MFDKISSILNLKPEYYTTNPEMFVKFICIPPEFVLLNINQNWKISRNKQVINRFNVLLTKKAPLEINKLLEYTHLISLYVVHFLYDKLTTHAEMFYRYHTS
jgi:hypothetical protein